MLEDSDPPVDFPDPLESPKAFIREIVDYMPKDSTLESIIDQVRLEAALAESEREIREGKVISHAEVMARMRQRMEQRR